MTGSTPDDPSTASFDKGSFHGSPGGPVGDLFLTRVVRMCRKRMVEGRTADILRMFRQVLSDSGRQIGIRPIRHAVILACNHKASAFAPAKEI
jgi:hypothetical protein